MITDRIVLDRQLQETIAQFEHKDGVVQKIDENTLQLTNALASNVPIIITTIQKFPTSCNLFVPKRKRELRLI